MFLRKIFCSSRSFRARETIATSSEYFPAELFSAGKDRRFDRMDFADASD